MLRNLETKSETNLQNASIDELNKLAEQNVGAAQRQLGWCYENGLGVKQNEALAFKYYESAIKNGYDDAYADLTVCFSEGKGVEENGIEATNYCKNQ